MFFLINTLLIVLLRTVRPFLGPSTCRFTISCGNFACNELKTKKLLPALWSIIKRLVCCHPFYQEKL